MGPAWSSKSRKLDTADTGECVYIGLVWLTALSGFPGWLFEFTVGRIGGHPADIVLASAATRQELDEFPRREHGDLVREDEEVLVAGYERCPLRRCERNEVVIAGVGRSH
jgi:hypothetical protein